MRSSTWRRAGWTAWSSEAATSRGPETRGLCRMFERFIRSVAKLGKLTQDPWDPWTPILERDGPAWSAARAAARGGPRVLIAPSHGDFQLGALLESALAAALTLRGADVEVLLGDQPLPACQLTEIATAPPLALVGAPPQPRCSRCHGHGRQVFDPLGLRVHWLGEHVTPEERTRARAIAATTPLADLPEFRLHGEAVGEHAVAGALRYFARGDFAGEPHAEEIQRHYLRAALLTAVSAENLIRKRAPAAACFNHGIYVPQGIIG